MRKLDLNKARDWREGLVTNQGEGERLDRSRNGMMKVVFVALMVIVAARLAMLQVVQGYEMRQRSENNRIFVRRLEPDRGVILDRSGEALVVNEPVYKVLTNDQGGVDLEPKPIGREEALERMARGDQNVIDEAGRVYPYGKVVAHVIGYVGELGPEEVETERVVGGGMIGREGIEREYDEVLSGAVGEELIEVDVGGKVLRRVGQTRPVGGLNVYLNIDLELQRLLSKELEGKVGAAIAVEPATGAVLAMVSSPAYDGNLFSNVSPEFREQHQGELAQVLQDSERPLINRAIAGAYPPGSVFKVVPATAGLETEVLDDDTEVEDTGVLTVDEYRYGNWYFDQYGRTEGQVDVKTALQRSNDIFFYKVGEWLGPERLAEWAREFGFGVVTGLDLAGEVQGLVPDPLWKEREREEPWYLGNTYHMAIGQGDLLVTPMQMSQMMGVIANGGRWCRPRIVDHVEGEEAGMVDCRELNISQETIELVKEGLVAACRPGGTGFPLFDFDLSVYGGEYASEERKVVGCKTGTAQFGDPEDRTHAWFSVFAPAENPEILITILVEAGGEGSEAAAPIAKAGLEGWFERFGGE